jgi:hypothetical protein
LTTEQFPVDLDTTSLALSITKPDTSIVHSVMDEMLEYLNSDGIIQVLSFLSELATGTLTYGIIDILRSSTTAL